MRNPFRRDLILLHPPALYDFRTRDSFLGPFADAVPSTAIFEMYPVGLTSIAAYLERNHYNVEIVNLAYRMLRDRTFDVPAYLARLAAPVFGIDLHWLPHAQGALAIATLVKQAHPDARILVGGLSASYYHEELMHSPDVDFVIRGDSTEEPVRQLLQALREGRPLNGVENLSWRSTDGAVVANPITFVPRDLDYVDVPAYRYLLRSMFKYGSLENVVPCLEWLRYPITLLLNARGCTEDCAICGGSRSAYARICNRTGPAYRSPARLAEDVRAIASFSRGPIFVVHDPRMGGMKRAVDLFARLEALQPANEMIFELYYPADDEFFEMVERSVPAWSLEITLESPDEELRRINGKFAWSNEVAERTIERALAHHARTVDIFFMVGLPHQRREDALRIPGYCEQLMQRFGNTRRLRMFVSPLGPFLDPGSRAFEDPSLGYHVFSKSLAGHCEAYLHREWQHILSYETDGMTRDEIATASYEVAARLNRLKHDHGVVDDPTYRDLDRRLRVARGLLADTRKPVGADHDELELANRGTMFGRDEMKWPVGQRFRVGSALLKNLIAGLAEEVIHTAARATGRFDKHVVDREVRN
jgi:B12-binding domain/radical SAM domain protein